LCAQKLVESIESDKPNLAKQHLVDKAIQETEFILGRIDERWPDGEQPARRKFRMKDGRSGESRHPG
jgi:hypothetical protein